MSLKENKPFDVKKYSAKRENLLPILQEITKKYKFLSKENLAFVAKYLDISEADVYGVASFYSFLELQPRGKNIIRICKTITCDMKNKSEIIKSIENRLNIKLGETSADGLFTVLETNCLGHCHEGPVMLINDEIYTNLTPDKTLTILDKYIS